MQDSDEDFKTWRKRIGWSQKKASEALGLTIKKITEFEADNATCSTVIDYAYRYHGGAR